jgi:hypothetical protein
MGVLTGSELNHASKPDRPRVWNLSGAREVRKALVSKAKSAATGQPIAGVLRSRLEARLGHDFSQVRIYTNVSANRAAASIGAQAFTCGRQVFFAAGQWAPGTPHGERLLVHELAHVVQQSRGETGSSAKLEVDAERKAQADSSPLNKVPAPLQPLSEPAQPLIQRYAVPGSLACDEVVAWLNDNSPYKPEWAETRCGYSFSNNLKMDSSTQPDKTISLRITGHDKVSVSMNAPIDVPIWNPSRRPNRAAEVEAWRAMRQSLDAHEAQHRQIGTTWKATLLKRYQELDFTVTGASKAEALASARSELEATRLAWVAEAQADQSNIDPFRGAILACPSASEEE